MTETNLVDRYATWLRDDRGVRATAFVLTVLTFGLSVPKHADFGYWAESRLAWVGYLVLGFAITFWLYATVIREFREEVDL